MGRCLGRWESVRSSQLDRSLRHQIHITIISRRIACDLLDISFGAGFVPKPSSVLAKVDQVDMRKRSGVRQPRTYGHEEALA